MLLFVSNLPDLPDDVLAVISAHLTDPRGMACASKACRTGAQPDVSRRLIESFLYYRALRITCVSRRVLMYHAFHQGPRYDEYPSYTCSMCRSKTECMGGCEHCRTMTREYPWMRVWYRALPVYVIRMFHNT